MSTVQEFEAVIPKLSTEELSKLKEMVDAVLESHRCGPTAGPAQTCGELAKRWSAVQRLPNDEGLAFADDVERARATVPPPQSKWD